VVPFWTHKHFRKAVLLVYRKASVLSWLVVLTILKIMKVNGIIPYMKWKIKNVPNHQPDKEG
jgi:hypothetical protein